MERSCDLSFDLLWKDPLWRIFSSSIRRSSYLLWEDPSCKRRYSNPPRENSQVFCEKIPWTFMRRSTDLQWVDPLSFYEKIRWSSFIRSSGRSTLGIPWEHLLIFREKILPLEDPAIFYDEILWSSLRRYSDVLILLVHQRIFPQKRSCDLPREFLDLLR